MLMAARQPVRRCPPEDGGKAFFLAFSISADEAGLANS
jgi:hypothetical protein